MCGELIRKTIKGQFYREGYGNVKRPLTVEESVAERNNCFTIDLPDNLPDDTVLFGKKMPDADFDLSPYRCFTVDDLSCLTLSRINKFLSSLCVHLHKEDLLAGDQNNSQERF